MCSARRTPSCVMPTIWLKGLGGVRCARRKGAQFPCDRRTAIARRTVSDCLGSTGVLAFKGCVVKSRPRWLLDFIFRTRAIQSSPPGLSPAQHILHIIVSTPAAERWIRSDGWESARDEARARPWAAVEYAKGGHEQRPLLVHRSLATFSCTEPTQQISSSRSSGISLSTLLLARVVFVFRTA